MKILKLAVFKARECYACGTMFQAEAGDEIEHRFYAFLGKDAHFAKCPVCGACCEIEIEKEQVTPPEKCVSCGDIIPEGRQVCPNCLNAKGEEK